MADDKYFRIKRKLYDALMEEKHGKVRRLCGELPEGPLQKISIYEDTVLHMAAHSEQKDLVLELLKMLPTEGNNQFSNIKNKDGNTILHEVATSDAMKDVAEELLRRDADLLIAFNDLGETPIFCAARHGQTQMFKFLAGKMKLTEEGPEDYKPYLRRKDGTTVLHISIANEFFGSALLIAKDYPYLIKERDQFSMTAFQYLACNPAAFQKKKIQIKRGFIEQFISKSKDQMKQGSIIQGLPDFLIGLCGDLFETDKIKNERLELEKLVEHLAMHYTSWDASINFEVPGVGERKELEIEELSSELSQKKEGQRSQKSLTNEYKKGDETPLFLATMSNIEEIVQEVLYFQLEAFTHTNKEGMNILHVAILYRHIDIFDMVVKHEVLARRLLSATDDEGNSVLHMVSKKFKSQTSEKMQSPALQLRDELLLFEKVKSASKVLVRNPLNKENKTAEELFAATNEKLHHEAKEWLMRTTENCTILSVFIATVAFAAVYTVPGGPHQETGIPILHSKPFFVVFVLADVISLTLALTSVGIFLSILTSSFPIEDFKTYLFKKLIQGIVCLVLSISMMAVAFGATTILIMTHNPKNVVWHVVAFLPVPIFFLSYSPLRSAVLGPCREWFKNFVVYFLIVVAIVVLISLTVLIFLFYGAFRGLRWTVKKACEFICNHLRWICGNKSESKSDTKSDQPTASPLSQV